MSDDDYRWERREFQHFPLDSWLLALLDGWRLPFVVQPTLEHHGTRAVTLWKPE